VGRTNIEGKNTYLANYLSNNHQTEKTSVLCHFLDILIHGKEWQEGIIDQDSKVVENRTLVIGQLYGTMDTIIMGRPIKSTHLFC
jgi:hypothetical protein